MGTGQDFPQHSVLTLNSSVRTIRVRTHNQCYFTAIELLDKRGQTIAKSQVWDRGDWKEWHLAEGEIITGIFCEAIPNSYLKSIGFICKKVFDQKGE
jgi:hypothetical protein